MSLNSRISNEEFKVEVPTLNPLLLSMFHSGENKENDQ